MALIEKRGGNYLSVIGGTIRKTVPEGTEGAIKREYERSDKTQGVKYELIYSALVGKIVSINIFDSDFGKQLSLGIKDDETYTLQMPLKGRYAMDAMKKLPNVDLEKRVEISPFDFENDDGRPIKGVSIKQDGEKIQNYFYDEITKKQDKEGFPQPDNDGEGFDSDDWQGYFNGVAKFLANYIVENVATKIKEEKLEIDYPDDEIDPADIPSD